MELEAQVRKAFASSFIRARIIKILQEALILEESKLIFNDRTLGSSADSIGIIHPNIPSNQPAWYQYISPVIDFSTLSSTWYGLYLFIQMRGVEGLLYLNDIQLIDQGTVPYKLPNNIQASCYPYATEFATYLTNYPDIRVGSGDAALWQARFPSDTSFPRNPGWLPVYQLEKNMSVTAVPAKEQTHTGNILRQLAYGGSRGDWPTLDWIFHYTTEPYDYWLIFNVNIYVSTVASTDAGKDISTNYSTPIRPINTYDVFDINGHIIQPTWLIYYQNGSFAPTPAVKVNDNPPTYVDHPEWKGMPAGAGRQAVQLAFANQTLRNLYIQKMVSYLSRLQPFGYKHLYLDTLSWIAPRYVGGLYDDLQMKERYTGFLRYYDSTTGTYLDDHGYYYVDTDGNEYGDGDFEVQLDPSQGSYAIFVFDTAYLWRKRLWRFVKECAQAIDNPANNLQCGLIMNMAATTVMEGKSWDEDPNDEPTLTSHTDGGGRWLLKWLEGVFYEAPFINANNVPPFNDGQTPAYSASLTSWENRVKSASQVGWRSLPLKVIYAFHSPGRGGSNAEAQAARAQSFAYGFASVLMAASYGLRNVYWSVSNHQASPDYSNDELGYHFPVESFDLGHPRGPWYWQQQITIQNKLIGLAVAYYERGVAVINVAGAETPIVPLNASDNTGVLIFIVPRQCKDVTTGTVYQAGTSIRVVNGRAFILSFL